jgi:hypothetical protein
MSPRDGPAVPTDPNGELLRNANDRSIKIERPFAKLGYLSQCAPQMPPKTTMSRNDSVRDNNDGGFNALTPPCMARTRYDRGARAMPYGRHPKHWKTA